MKSRPRTKKAGLAPGTLVYVGEQKRQTVHLSIFHFDPENLVEIKDATLDDCLNFRDEKPVTWINIDGVHDVELIRRLGEHYNIHPLTLEDILNTSQRPKMEEYDEYIYITLRMLFLNEKDPSVIVSEQVSIVLNESVVISFQDTEGDVFNQIRDRIRSEKVGRIRKRGADYVAYALIDAIVDNYFVVLERTGEKVAKLDDELTESCTPDVLRNLYEVKRFMLGLRKAVWPLRDLANALSRSESEFLRESTDIFFRDVHDHVVQVIETVEIYRDMLGGMFDIYMTVLSNRTNEVMKVLTIIATIFIPLTFIVGVYGMNFDFMPELRWRYGYPAIMTIMSVIAAFMLAYFRRRRWL